MKIDPKEISNIYTEVLTLVVPEIRWQRDKYCWTERQTRCYVVHTVTKRYADCLPWIGRHHLIDYVMEKVYGH